MGAPSRSTTPDRVGWIAGEAATVGAGGDSLRVGLNRLRAATDAYPPADGGAVSPGVGAGGVGRVRPAWGMGIGVSSWRTMKAAPAAATTSKSALITINRFGIRSLTCPGG